MDFDGGGVCSRRNEAPAGVPIRLPRSAQSLRAGSVPHVPFKVFTSVAKTTFFCEPYRRPKGLLHPVTACGIARMGRLTVTFL